MRSRIHEVPGRTRHARDPLLPRPALQHVREPVGLLRRQDYGNGGGTGHGGFDLDAHSPVRR